MAPPRGIFYGWWIVLATAFINFWGAGAFNFSFTAFLRPMVQEMGWSYAGISVAMSLRSLEGGIMSPTVGYLTDKIGPRRILLAGAFLAGASAILLSRIGSLWAFYTLFVLLSMGFSMMMPVPGATAIAHWFSRKRGTALGLSSAAYGASGVLIPLIAWIIAQHSWRTAFVVAGVGMWAIGIPAALMVRHRPEPYGLLPDGDSLSSGQGNTRSLVGKGLTHEEDGLSVRQAVRTRAFWMISMVATVSGVGLSVMSLHVMPSLLSVNIPLVTAGFIASLFPLASIPGRIGFGWLGDHIDRIDKRHLLTVAVLLNVLGLLIFAFSHTVPLAVLAMTLFGVGFGGVNTLRV
ncbi:MAG: MFS transporter, partial [Chloroflexi bacterium]|nr:MFS transporter [Chloroflexota bacterium]